VISSPKNAVLKKQLKLIFRQQVEMTRGSTSSMSYFSTVLAELRSLCSEFSGFGTKLDSVDNRIGSPFCLWPSDCLIHLRQVERGLVETLRPEAKYQRPFTQCHFTMTLLLITCLYILFSLLGLLFAHRTYCTAVTYVILC